VESDLHKLLLKWILVQVCSTDLNKILNLNRILFLICGFQLNLRTRVEVGVWLLGRGVRCRCRRGRSLLSAVSSDAKFVAGQKEEARVYGEIEKMNLGVYGDWEKIRFRLHAKEAKEI